MLVDISERRHCDDARHELAAIVESSDDAIVSKDLNGAIQSWNKGAERLFGYTAKEAIGQSITVLIPSDRQDEEPKILARLRGCLRIKDWGVLCLLVHEETRMDRSRYASNLTDDQWSIVEPLLPVQKRFGRRRRVNRRAVIDAIFYLLRTGCQWRQLPREFPTWGTVYWYFRSWQRAGVWVRLQREIYRLTRLRSGRTQCPSVVIMDGQSVKTTEVGGTRGFDAFKRVKGRKRHICRYAGPADRQPRRGCRCFGPARRSPADQWIEANLPGNHHRYRRRWA